jgi:hypothetical protein
MVEHSKLGVHRVINGSTVEVDIRLRGGMQSNVKQGQRKLTPKQIETTRPEASKYMIDDQPGILVKDFDINKPTSKRLRSKGYSTVEIGDDLLVFKPKQK